MELSVEFVAYDSGLDSGVLLLLVDFEHFAEVLRYVYYEAAAYDLPCEGCACCSWYEGDFMLKGKPDDLFEVLF